MSNLKRASIALVGSLLMASAAWAQVTRGTITGIATDPSGAIVPQVAIKITNKATGVVNDTTTNSTGAYVVPQLPSGTYGLTAMQKGFKQFVQTDIALNVGETVRLDIALTIGSETQSVQVTGEAPLLKRETSDTGTSITSTQVDDLPLTSVGDQRTLASFIQLAPGTTGRGNSTGGPGAGRTMTTAVSGSMVSSTTLSVDGADVTSGAEFEGDLRALQIPPDAISEFKLQSTNAGAEYGRSGGGSASFAMKSGTNQIHGSVFELLRNNALNTRSFFQKDVSRYQQNEFGATAGGPIVKDKAFIFGYYDGFRLNQGVSGGFATIPTAEMQAGDFRNYGSVVNGVFQMRPIYDPISHTTCGTLVCNNQINPSNFDPIAAKVLPLIPTPTKTDPRQVVNNYSNTVSNPLSVTQWGLKGDYVFTSNHRISAMYSWGKNSTPNIPLIPAPLGGGDQPSINETRNIRLNYSWIIKPNLINQLTLGLNQWNSGQQALTEWAGKSDWVSYLGIKGVAASLPTQFPQLVINDQSWNGGGGAGSSNQHATMINDSMTWIHGRHTVKFGFQYMKSAVNQLSTGNGAGYFRFRNEGTALAGDNSTGIAFASFLLGRAYEGNSYHLTSPTYSRNAYYAGFVQDDFKLSSKLTLNLGLRWDLFSPFYDKYNKKSWVNPTAPNPLANNLPGLFEVATDANRSGMDGHHKNFSPRIGLAYSLNSKTVIRASYGIFFAQGNGTRFSASSATVQGWNGTLGSTSPDNDVTPGFILSQSTLPPFTPYLGADAFFGQGRPTSSAGTLIMIDRSDGQPPYMQNYMLDIQRQLPGSMTLSVAYIGNMGTHLASRVTPWDKLPPQYLSLGSLLLQPLSNPAAQVLPVVQAMPIDLATGNHSPFSGFEATLGGAATVGQSLRLNPQYRGLHRYYEGVGVSAYHAMQIKLDKHFSNGLSLLVSYAWSKTLTDGGSIFSTFSSQFATTTPWDRQSQYSYSFNDIPSRLSVAYTYELPFGQGKKYLNQGGAVNAILGGWKTSGIFTYESGRGFNVNCPGGPQVGYENNGWNRCDKVIGQSLGSAAMKDYGNFDPAKDLMFNSNSLAVPADYTFGTMTDTTVEQREFPYFNEDISILKDWKITERFDLRFRTDFFNVFNRHVFGDNNGAYSNEPFFSGPNSPGFGAVGNTTNYPRLIQFGLNVRW